MLFRAVVIRCFISVFIFASTAYNIEMLAARKSLAGHVERGITPFVVDTLILNLRTILVFYLLDTCCVKFYRYRPEQALGYPVG